MKCSLLVIWIWWYCLTWKIAKSYRLLRFQSLPKIYEKDRLRLFLSQPGKKDDKSFFITGCTGVLGATLLNQLESQGYFVQGTYRNSKLMNQLRPNTEQHRFHKVDLTHFNEWDHFFVHLFQKTNHSQFTLINNAAIYPPSKSNIFSLRESLAINFLAPVRMTESLLAARPSSGKIDIINISSGDGELLYLTSSIAEQLQRCQSIEDLKLFAKDLMSSSEESSVHAFGPSPSYSLSKAFLNQATKLLHKSLVEQRQIDSCRVIAVCPGNFLSSMTTTEELEDSDLRPFLLPVEEAARRMIPVILNEDRQFPGGRFYRYGEEIAW